MNDSTQHRAIIRYLQQTIGWVPGYLLSKAELCGTWVGSRGERSARDLVSLNCPKGLEGKVERELGSALLAKNVVRDFLGKSIEKRYVYYRSVVNQDKLF